MSEATTLEYSLPAAPENPLACRLRPKSVMGQRGPIANMAEVELENVSAGPLEVVYRMTSLQYLNLVVTDKNGAIISEGHFGDRFAPTLEPATVRLEPGEKMKANVHLFATVRREPLAPGTYAVQAVYQYNGFRAESEP